MIVVVVALIVVVIAKIILTAVVPEKKVHEKVCAGVNAVVGTVAIRIVKVPVVIKRDGGEDSASFFKFIIPIASPINATTRCPYVASRNPDPIFLTRVPMARTPEILLAIGLEFPVAWAVKIVVVGSFNRRAAFKITWRLGQVAEFFLV